MINERPLVSIIINNYNYGQFLRDAIESVLAQTYSNVEVVVVDDGSTDNSRDIIAEYGERIVPVLKVNGGQASAFNRGFEASRGGLLCFLDADDYFEPRKAEAIVELSDRFNLVNEDALICHPLMVVDRDRVPLEVRKALPQIMRGSKQGANYYDWAVKYRYAAYPSLPSAVAISWQLANRIFPIPEGFPTGGDNFIVRTAGVLGKVYLIDEILASYRSHGGNHWYLTNKPKSAAFSEAEERFINQRLVENGKQPVISFFNSMNSIDFYFYHNKPGDLLRLAVNVPFHHFDHRTVRFSARAAWRSGQGLLRLVNNSVKSRKPPR